MKTAVGSQRSVLAIAGSLRGGSLNLRLIESAADCAPPGIAVRVYRGLAELPPLNQDLEARAFAEGAVRSLCDQVASADGLLIATPEYNHSVPGVLKNAIDWLSRPLSGEVLVGKPVAVVGASAGRWGTRLAQAALRQVLFAAEALVLTGPPLYLAQADQAFDADGRLADEAARRALRQLLLLVGTSARGGASALP
ncbi:MAG TPA: NAD(P)H-dependent oxidoreductase [Steroidobacteraceae bacterium]|nr:NAD(P)H-dependent oxidoreductase [Steroidobacteraceae bacterium]